MNFDSTTRWTSGILLITVFIHLNASSWMTLLFELNRQNIAASSCEKVVRNCNGHCYLNKQIQKENSAPESTSPAKTGQEKSTKDIKENWVPGSSGNTVLHQSLTRYPQGCCGTLPDGDLFPVFHPPDFAA